MPVFEITGYKSGVSNSGVTYLEPADSFEYIFDGFINRQLVQSRMGYSLYNSTRLAGNTRVTGIFEFVKIDGSRDLLASDMNFLYKYNTSTKVFDQLVFAGSMAGYGGFNISNNEDYISGTFYPTALNENRFVFCGRGIAASNGSSIFFYNGTDVRDFTSVVDNPTYVSPSLGSPPAAVALQKSVHVIYFNERINFIYPTIAAVEYSRSILFSAIRNAAGDGNNFNNPGSGLLTLDSLGYIKTASILGDEICLNLTDSSYMIQKTSDVFNPYKQRKIPSVIGTNASFSAQEWNSKIRSVGRSGIISTDGRQSGRIDNKIPYFTRDEMDQKEIDIIYSGFDRRNELFLFSYILSESGSTTQNRVLVENYGENSWSIYRANFSVFGQSQVGNDLTWDDIFEDNDPSWATWDTTEEVWDKIGLGESVEKTLAGDDLGFIYELNTDYDDNFVDITAITNASQAVLTVSESSFIAGDKVVVKGVSGMTEINNYDPSLDPTKFTPYEVVSATDTSVTLNVDSTNFTAYSSDGTLSKIINFECKTNPFNPFRSEGRKCFISMIEFLVNVESNFIYVDVYADDDLIKEDVLCSVNRNKKNNEWLSITINSEAEFFTFVIKHFSPAVGVKFSSIRIHAKPGSLTGG